MLVGLMDNVENCGVGTIVSGSIPHRVFFTPCRGRRGLDHCLAKCPSRNATSLALGIKKLTDSEWAPKSGHNIPSEISEASAKLLIAAVEKVVARHKAANGPRMTLVEQAKRKVIELADERRVALKNMPRLEE